MYKYDIINKLLIHKFGLDISGKILNFIYPKKYLNVDIINKYNIQNHRTNTIQTVTLYDNIGQQNCVQCGHIEIIITDKPNDKFKLITLNKIYNCNCKLETS